MPFHCLLVHIFPEDKFMGILSLSFLMLYVIFFPLSAFKIYSLSLVLAIYLCIVLFACAFLGG